MPIGARSPLAMDSPVPGWTSATSGPLPFEQLLRADGSGTPDAVGAPHLPGHYPSASTAAALLERDADLVLAVTSHPTPNDWRTRRFSARVARVRRDLEPIPGTAALAASFAREHLHDRPFRPRPDAVRVAYAVRWLELEAGLSLPSWPEWMRDR